MTAIIRVRPSPIAGSWYPGEPDELRQSIERYLDGAAPVEVPGEIKALIVPHAGYVYSGQVAAHAYNAARNLPVKTVAIISPMHHYHPAAVLTSAHAAYQTPLGEIPIAGDLLQEIDLSLRESLPEGLTPVANDQEHSLEIQLPFLQVIYPGGFQLVPIMLRDQSPESARALAAALSSKLPQDTLLVASSDLSHFYSEREARQLDDAILKAVLDFSPEEVYRVEARGEGYACGLGAITTILWAAGKLGADRVILLNQSTSAAVTGDRTSVVGYGSAAVYRST